MKAHRSLHSSFRGNNPFPGKPFRLATLMMTTVFVTAQMQAQSLDLVSTDTSSNAPAVQSQTAIAPQPSQLVSAPVPAQQEEAKLLPLPDAPLAPEKQNASQNSTVVTPEHQSHALAKTGAIVGIVLLVAGAGAYALQTRCNNPSNTVCTDFRYTGIGLMAGGGAMAGTGFYFWFHK